MSAEAEFSEFETKPIGRLIARLAIPCIVSQLITLLYNVIDRIFLGRIGKEGAMILAGVGLVAPILTMVNAFSGLVGAGGGPLAAIAMGRKEKKEARQVLYNSFVLLIVLSVVITIVLLLFGNTLLLFFGASQDNIDFAKKYLDIYMLGTIFVMLSQGLNPFLLTQGFNKESMIYTMIGVLANIILDPVFIYVFRMGVGGAAAASVISQMISAFFILRFLFGDRTILRIRKERLSWRIIEKIVGLGVSSFFMAITSGFVQSLYYKQLAVYGNSNHIAAMSVIYTLAQFIFLISNGIGQGAQPVMSYNYGAKNIGRLKQSIFWVNAASILFAAIAQGIIMIFPGSLFRIFTSDEAVIKIGIRAIRLFVFGKTISSIQFGMQYVFRSIGDAKTAMYNATVRKLLFIIPLMYWLPTIGTLGVDGVYMAESVGDLLAGINVTITYAIRRKKIFEKMKE